MKLLGKEIRLPRILGESFKGFFTTAGAPKRKRKFWTGELSWKARCEYNDQIYHRFPLCKSQVLTIAGQLTAEGVFTEAAYTEGPHKQSSDDAKDKIDDLNKQIGLDSLLYETAIGMAKYGGNFWEKTFDPVFDARVLPMQEDIEPHAQDLVGNITHWRQNVLGQRETPTWSVEQIVHFPWNVTSKSWPYGTSLLTGLDIVFEILEQLETDIKDFMHKAAFPYEVLGIGDKEYRPTADEVSAAKTKWKNKVPGEHILTNYPVNLVTGGTGDKTITNLNDILNFLKDECIDGLLVPPISKQWSSTMASATEMLPWAQANLIRPMQRIIRRKIEQEIYKPYLMDIGFSVKVCPKLLFESPDAHKDEEAEYWALQVQSGIVPAEYAALEQGFDMDKIKQMREEEQKRQEEQMQQQMAQQEQSSINPKQGIKQKVNPKEGEE